MLCSKGRAGSSPALGTRFQAEILVCELRKHVLTGTTALSLSGSLDRRWRVSDPAFDGEGEAQKRPRCDGKDEKQKGNGEQETDDESRSHLHDVDDHGHTVNRPSREH